MTYKEYSVKFKCRNIKKYVSIHGAPLNSMPNHQKIKFIYFRNSICQVTLENFRNYIFSLFRNTLKEKTVFCDMVLKFSKRSVSSFRVMKGTDSEN